MTKNDGDRGNCSAYALDGQNHNDDIRHAKHCAQQLPFRHVHQGQGVFGFEEKDQQSRHQCTDRKCQECAFEYANLTAQLAVDSRLDTQHSTTDDGEKNHDNSHNVTLPLCNHNQRCCDENQRDDAFTVNFPVSRTKQAKVVNNQALEDLACKDADHRHGEGFDDSHRRTYEHHY